MLAPSPVPPPDELAAALGRGHALFERGEIAAAIAVYDAAGQRATRRSPRSGCSWASRATPMATSRTRPTALRASLCLDTALWPAGFYLARAYERLGRRAEALQQYDLIAVDDLQPLALRSTSAVINELRAFRHDFRNAARRLTAERTVPARRPLR